VHLSVPALLLLAVTGLLAGMVDAIAGGGGMISLPMLLNLGVPPAFALGTSKFQSSCGTLIAARHYVREGLVDLRACRLGIAFTFVGALLGAGTVQLLDSSALARIIPWLLVTILIYAIFRPEIGQVDQPPKMGPAAFYALMGLSLGFYDAFFGPGAGSLWTVSLILLLGHNFTKATGYTKVMNLVSNVTALAVFIAAGKVLYGAGITMAAGQIIGARFGAEWVVKKGARFIRPVFLTIVALTVVHLLFAGVRR